jgi:hypothetical protein
LYKGTEYPATLYGEYFDKMVLDIHNQYDNLNILLKRTEGGYNEKERYQSLDESKTLDNEIENTLIKNNISYITIEVGDNTVNDIVKLLV